MIHCNESVCHSSSQVLNLKVRCSRHNDGCQWVGELRHVVPHEREECGWAVVECSYQCGAHLPRRLMDEHQRDECPQRPMDVRLESFMKRMEERHEREMKKMEARLLTERERHEREMKEIVEDKHRSEIVAMKSEMIESDKRQELELAKQRNETEIKMAELKVTIISSTHYVVTTPPQDEYTSKIAETLERVRKIEEESIPQNFIRG